MKYTYQTVSESHSFAAPEGTDVEHASNLGDLRAALDEWRDEHGNVGTSEEYAQIIVWHGTLDDVTDEYPDFILRPGPRGGMIKESC